MWKTKLELSPGETVRPADSVTRQDPRLADVQRYEIVNQRGQVVGVFVYIAEPATAPPSARRHRLMQWDAQGVMRQDLKWTDTLQDTAPP